jgi:hypothetical protein
LNPFVVDLQDQPAVFLHLRLQFAVVVVEVEDAESKDQEEGMEKWI